MNEEAHTAIAVVRNDELRVAIGKRGINAILAVKLTNWKIDIKEQDVAFAEGITADSLELMARKEEAMILERRRSEILKQNELEKETEVVEESPVVEESAVVEETPVVEETIVVEYPVKEEPVVEYNPVRMQPKVSLADLEKQIEEEKKKKTQQTTSKKKSYKKEEEVEEEEVKKVDPTNYMSIYTDEELEEFEYEDEEENEYDDDDIDYSEYDSYYDE